MLVYPLNALGDGQHKELSEDTELTADHKPHGRVGSDMTSGKDRAYQTFWIRLMAQIHTRYPDWKTPGRPPATNSMAFATAIGWFSYGTSFARGRLRSELFIRVPHDAAAGQRILNAMQARHEELEADYGKGLNYEFMSRTSPNRLACRVADYRSGDIDQIGDHDEYLAWFLDSQSRLRGAVDHLGGLPWLRQRA